MTITPIHRLICENSSQRKAQDDGKWAQEAREVGAPRERWTRMVAVEKERWGGLKRYSRSSHCDAMGSVAPLEHWDARLIPSLAQKVKDPLLPQLGHPSQLSPRSDPWPGHSMCCRVAKKGTRKKKFIPIQTQAKIEFISQREAPMAVWSISCNKYGAPGSEFAYAFRFSSWLCLLELSEQMGSHSMS